jgi:hypothetical protein
MPALPPGVPALPPGVPALPPPFVPALPPGVPAWLPESGDPASPFMMGLLEPQPTSSAIERVLTHKARVFFMGARIP